MNKVQEKRNKDLSSAIMIMAQVNYLWQKGSNFTQSGINLEDLDSKVVLAALAVELLVKSWIGTEICLQNISESEEEIKNKINNKFKSMSHDFEKMFNNSPELKSDMNIASIERVNHTGFIDEFRIKLHGEEFPLLFKTLEASRYGSFSLNSDVFTLADRHREDDFLEKLSKKTYEKIRLTYVCLNNIKNEK